MKYNVKYGGAIHSIGADPFEAIYYSFEQINLLKDTIYLGNEIYLILNQKIIEKTRMKAHICNEISFLCFATEIDNKVFSFAQGLSENVDGIFVEKLLLQVFKLKIPLPQNVFVNYDQLLLDEVSMALNQCTFEEYNVNCFNNLSPDVVINVDIISMLIYVNNFKCFGFKSILVKELYLKSLIELSLSTSLQSFNETLEIVFFIMFTNFRDVNLKRKVFSDRFKNIECEQKFENFLQTENVENEISQSNIQFKVGENAVKFYIQNMKDKIVTEYNNARSASDFVKGKNAYFLPELYPELEIFLIHFSAWTKIVNNQHCFDSVSSLTLKNFREMTDDKIVPLTASKFLDTHILRLKESMMEGRSLISKTTCKLPNDKEKINIHHSSLNFVENWMGLNKIKTQLDIDDENCNEIVQVPVPSEAQLTAVENLNETILSISSTSSHVPLKQSTPNNTNENLKNVQLEHSFDMKDQLKITRTTKAIKKADVRKRKYVTPNPAMRIIHKQKIKGKTKKEQLILNDEPKGMRVVNKERFKIGNTSTLDSISEILRFAYLNFRDFQQSQDLICSKYCNDICLLKCLISCINSGKLAAFYTIRPRIMKHFGETRGDRITFNDNVGSFFSLLMDLHWSYNTNIYCVGCNNINNTTETRIQIIKNSTFDIKNLQQYIDEYLLSGKDCIQCNEKCDHSHNFRSYIAIELNNMDHKIHLSKIPQQIMVQDDKNNTNNFALAGVIAEDDNGFNDNVAYCRTIENFWDKRSDVEKSIKKLRRLPSVKIHFLFYVKC